MILLHPYVPGCREDDQAPTWAFLERAARVWPVHEIDLSWDPLYGYPTSLRALWPANLDWLIIEHDVEPQLSDVEAMEHCPQLLCTAPYSHSSHAAMDLTGHHVPLGFTRITARARRVCGDWPVPAGVTFHVLDSYLTSALAQAVGPWHPHPSVVHHHKDGDLSAPN